MASEGAAHAEGNFVLPVVVLRMVRLPHFRKFFEVAEQAEQQQGNGLP